MIPNTFLLKCSAFPTPLTFTCPSSLLIHPVKGAVSSDYRVCHIVINSVFMSLYVPEMAVTPAAGDGDRSRSLVYFVFINMSVIL